MKPGTTLRPRTAYAGLKSCATRGTRLQPCAWVTTAVGVVIGGSASVLACPQCFGAEEASVVDGTKLGILVLLALTLAVQGLFAAFFLHLRKRAKRFADAELENEWPDLQRASRTS